MRIVKIVEEKAFGLQFVCAKCSSTIEIACEDVLVGWFGANYGGETPDKKYYVCCPVCEKSRLLKYNELNDKVRRLAEKRHAGKKK